MEFAAPAFADSTALSHDLTKPIVATEALVPGQVLFAEVATFVSSGGHFDDEESHEDDCEDEDCGGCCEFEGELAGSQEAKLEEDDLEFVGPYVVEHFDQLMDTCEPLSALVSIDKRKNLFKFFHACASSNDALVTSLLALDMSCNPHLSAMSLPC